MAYSQEIDIEDIWAQQPPRPLPPEFKAYFDDLVKSMQTPENKAAIDATFRRFGRPATVSELDPQE